MNFQVILGEGASQEQRVITTSSWSTCLVYCEGTELPITSIQLLPSVTIVVVDSGTANCYQSTFKTNGVNSQYFVWANDFTSFTTWINTLTDATLQSVQNTTKLYVTV